MSKTAKKYSIIFFILTFFISIFIDVPNKAHKQIEGKHINGAVNATKMVAR